MPAGRSGGRTPGRYKQGCGGCGPHSYESILLVSDKFPKGAVEHVKLSLVRMSNHIFLSSRGCPPHPGEAPALDRADRSAGGMSTGAARSASAVPPTARPMATPLGGRRFGGRLRALALSTLIYKIHSSWVPQRDALGFGLAPGRHCTGTSVGAVNSGAIAQA